MTGDNVIQMPGAEDALAKLEEAEAAEAAAAQAGAEPTGAEREAGAERAAQEAASGQGPETKNKTDTPAGAEARPGDDRPTKPPKDDDRAGKPASEQTDRGTERPGESSRYQKSKERLDKTWETVNQRKAELETVKQGLDDRQKAIDAVSAELERKRQQFDAQRRITPEKYEAFAGQMRAKADQLKREAERLEDAGEEQKAAALRTEAVDAESDARKALRLADETRKNPPATDEQQAVAQEAKKREWTLKTAVDFPEFGKTGSEFQKAFAGHWAAVQQNNPEWLEHPDLVYHVARLTAAETAAARVSGLEKELGQLRAKVKEYESLTTLAGRDAPGGGGAPSGAKTDAQEEAELRQMAEQVGTIPR